MRVIRTERANNATTISFFHLQFYSLMSPIGSCGLVGTMVCVEFPTFGLLSGAPKLVCRRNNDPKTRRLFDSSEFRDDNEPVLEYLLLDDIKWFKFFCTWNFVSLF